ncbi:MAG: exodeoxyribonuclease VII small subunit [Eubacteriales bacterium]
MKNKEIVIDESFEEIFKKLEKTVEALQNENISLDSALKNFEEGMKDYDKCVDILNKAKQKVLQYESSSSSLKELKE